MQKPKIQIALDNTDMQEAIKDALMLAEHVDVLEVGTLLAFAASTDAVREIRDLFPQKELVADLKIIDAGQALAKLAFKGGANAVTVTSAAHISTFAAAAEVAKAHQGEVQVELFGLWGPDDIKAWQDLGIHKAIYHRSRDNQTAWSIADLKQLHMLIEGGIMPAVTGGVTDKEISFFKDLPIDSFIIGRALRDASNPAAYAAKIRNEIEKYW